MPQAYSFPYHHILHRSLPINRHYLTSEEVNTRSSSTVQTDCFYPFPTLLALTDQFLQSYFNLIEPNSVFTAFGLMTPNSGTTEDDLFSALLFSSYDEVNTRIGRKPVSICFFFLCKSFGFFVLTREKKLLLEGWYIFWALNDRGALCFHVLAVILMLFSLSFWRAIIHTRLRDEDGKYLLYWWRKGHDGHLSRSGRGGGRGGKEGR